MKTLRNPVLQALIDALRFQNGATSGLRSLSDTEWNKLLALCDHTQLTLLLGWLHSRDLPAEVRARITRNSRDNAARSRRWSAMLDEIAEALARSSIDFVLLKGPSHSPHLSPDPLLRAYGDIDLWFVPEQVHAAASVLESLGYRPLGTSKGRHLAPLVRPSKWEWRGDHFAPDLPISVDLHYGLWDAKLECIAGPDEHAIWQRRTAGPVSTLARPDLLTFAVLHFLMHLLHGDLRLHRAWEIAYFLHTHTADIDFWHEWRGLYKEEVRRLQLVAFSLARLWFQCEIPAPLAPELNGLPPEVRIWIEHYGWSPVGGLVSPNKNELWLNLSLVQSRRVRFRILARRLFPKPDPVNAPEAPKQLARAFLLRRIRYHLGTFLPSCASGIAWLWRSQQISSEFIKFLCASALFDFGEFVFFLLYNLYLLDLGYREQFIGRIAATLTAGTLAGVLPASFTTKHWGLRTAALVAIAGTCCATLLRALLTSPAGLFGSAFLNGFFMAFWTVTMLPAVAGFAAARNRPFAFSLISALGIGVGSFAGFIGGRLPALLARFPAFHSPVSAKRAALIAGSLFASLALAPALLTRFPQTLEKQPAEPQRETNRFLYFFLLCLFGWMIGTGAFNPFANVYFANRLHLEPETIGTVFSLGQIAQVIAIIAAPIVLKRLGYSGGITVMQFATAAALLLLAVAQSPATAAPVYIGYVCFQYMSEPCLFSMLMSRTPEPSRSHASALNFAVTSIASIVGTFVAGTLLSTAGYTVTFCSCAAIIVLAALLLLSLQREPGMHTSRPFSRTEQQAEVDISAA